MTGFLLFLAPMEGHTTSAFRELCYAKGADATFTEMARISGLARGNKSTNEKISIPKPIPTHIQLLGSDEEELEKFLESFKAPAGFLGFNLNLGCPSPNMVQKGFGCALIKRITKVKKLVQIIRKHNHPVSIKMRLGLNAYEKERKAYLNLIREVDADLFIVHARHGKETYDSPADFKVYEECVTTGKAIIANGDIRTVDQILRLQAIGVKGAMIGRAAVEDPEVFSRLRAGLATTHI